jgi:uncharacterized protein
MTVRVAIKAVSGASREGVAGVLGDRVKVRVAAASEQGKANRAIIAVMARELGIKPSQVVIVAGATSPEKVLALTGVERATIAGLWGDVVLRD